MKVKLKLTGFIFLVIDVLILLLSSSARSQKLPKLQADNVLLPTDIKIDGKATEWGDKFQAYNHNTDIFYTIANNDKYLYLIVRATDPQIVTKIVRGGITLNINRFKKSEANAQSVTFPVMDNKGRAILVPILLNRESIESDSGKSSKAIDSINSVFNKQFAATSKEIRVAGIKSITDSLLSIYNSEGILTAGLLDKSGALTYELKVPIKLLDLSAGKFFYNIKLNGGSSVLASHTYANGVTVSTESISISTYVVTDFWGEYPLIKSGDVMR